MPRRNGLAEEVSDALPCRVWNDEGHRQHSVSGGEHDGRTFCPLGDAAAMPTIGFVKKFRKEFEDHLDGKPCPYAKHLEVALV
jgi:hypothetical protein